MGIERDYPVTHGVGVGRQVCYSGVEVGLIERLLFEILVVHPLPRAVDDGQGFIFAAYLIVEPDINLLGRFGDCGFRFRLGFDHDGMAEGRQGQGETSRYYQA